MVYQANRLNSEPSETELPMAGSETLRRLTDQASDPEPVERPSGQVPVSFRHYWYVACRSQELRSDKPLGREILGEWIVLFRDETGAAVVFQDRCPHRNYRLSLGKVVDGRLQCPYHGWTYDKSAEVVAIPCEGEKFKQIKSRRAFAYEVMERDDFVYVRLEKHPTLDLEPFPMPHYGEKGYHTVRLFNVFANNVTNCAENYVDVPHTVFVHPGIFRVERKQRIEAAVTRKAGSVIVDFHNETDNMGWFSWFLNPKKEPIQHRDAFHAPNVTSVDYHFSASKSFHITSHCTPVRDNLTHVYTDLTYRFGFLNRLAAPIVRYQGQSVIDQDIEALNIQMQVIEKFGENFSHSRTDVVHLLIESLRDAIAAGVDPRSLPDKSHDFEFWI